MATNPSDNLLSDAQALLAKIKNDNDEMVEKSEKLFDKFDETMVNVEDDLAQSEDEIADILADDMKKMDADEKFMDDKL